MLLVAHDVNPLLPYVDRVLYLAGGRAAMGPVEEVITSATLSRLYGAPIEVLRTTDGRLVVVGQPEAPHLHGPRHVLRMSPHLTFNLVSDVHQLLAYQFMVNALQAAGVVAVTAAVVGWFMVLRAETFAGHTLSMMSFPGAAAAALAGLPLAWGYFVFCGAGALRHRGLLATGGVGGAASAAQSAVMGMVRRGRARGGLPAAEPLRRRAREPGDAAVRLDPRRSRGARC